MKRRNLIYILGILLCLMQAGCLDDSYTGTVFVEEEMEEGALHEIRMTIGGAEQTRGSGVIGDVSSFAGKDFYVYAFNRDTKTDYSTVSATDSLRCLVDGSYDDPESLMGRRAYWNPATEVVEWGVGESPIYYPMGENEGHDFDFFAYYLDNIEPANEDIIRSNDDIKINIEIDGSQDLMSAKAKPTKAQLEDILDKQGEVAMLLQREHCYSYYTASHNLNPNFDFIHHLVKLDFKLVPGGTPGMTKDVTVEKIEIRTKHKATFTVADKYDDNRLGLKFREDTTRLVLKERDGSEYRPRLISTVNKVGAVTDGIVDDLGSLLVAPDVEYYLYIVLGEVQENGLVLESKENEKVIYQGTEEDKIEFTAGNEYLITLTIYGQMDVRVNAEIGKWEEGGDYEYDYDDTTRPNQGKN